MSRNDNFRRGNKNRNNNRNNGSQSSAQNHGQNHVRPNNERNRQNDSRRQVLTPEQQKAIAENENARYNNITEERINNTERTDNDGSVPSQQK